VKTLDLAILTVAALCVVTLLGASLWSRDTTMFLFFGFCSFGFSVFFFIFDLLCKRFSYPPCIIGPLVAIYSGAKA
jgi:hypothetical protein